MIDMSLKLPCGAEIPNRLCKAAMTEGLPPQSVNPRLRSISCMDSGAMAEPDYCCPAMCKSMGTIWNARVM